MDEFFLEVFSDFVHILRQYSGINLVRTWRFCASDGVRQAVYVTMYASPAYVVGSVCVHRPLASEGQRCAKGNKKQRELTTAGKMALWSPEDETRLGRGLIGR